MARAPRSDRPRGALRGGPVAAVLFDYGLTLAGFSRPHESLARAQEQVGRLIRDRGHDAPPPALLREAVHDRIEREVLAHDGSGALEEVDVAALERQAFADLGLHLDDATLDACSSAVQTAWLDGVFLFDDVLPSLEQLKRAGLRIGLCSNAAYRPASMRAQLAHLGLEGLLDAAVFSAEVGWRKPSPHLFDAALRALGAAADATVFVGDRLREDVRGAQGHGMRAVLIDRSGESVRDDRARVADAVIASLRQLPPLLPTRMHAVDG